MPPPAPAPETALDMIPPAHAVHEQIRQLARTERILRKLLTVSLAAEDARAAPSRGARRDPCVT